MSSIVTMVLASQPGEGFTSSRWLSPLGDSTVLGHVLDDARSWPAEPALVVVGSDAEDVLSGVDFSRFAVIIDPEWADGEIASLRAGLDFLARESDADAILLVSGDTPVLPSNVVPQLLSAHETARRPATVPKYRYARGRPIVIARELWPRLLGADEHTTVEGVLATHSQWVTEVWVDHLPPRRIVTPADLRVLLDRR